MNTNLCSEIVLPKIGQTKLKKIRLNIRYNILRLPRVINNPVVTRKFLRLNDRKKYFYIEDFKRAGYHLVCLPNNMWHGSPAIKEWCNNTVGPNWCAMGQWFIFQNEQDALAFKMVWE